MNKGASAPFVFPAGLMLCYNAPQVVYGFRKRPSMRLSSAQIEVIKQEPENCFGTRDKARMLDRQLRHQSGFTMVELVTVMVIVGILAATVLPRFFTVSEFEDRGSADQVKSMLRFAQKTAIAQHRIVSVAISGGAASPNCTTTLAGASPELTCQVKSSVVANTVTFNALGQRTSATGSITVGGTAITIEAETGYVH
jgi:MSHA pilin protein MshC